MSDRNLTDADVQAIITEFKDEFLMNLGSGVMDLAWKGLVVILILLAAYGVGKAA